LWLIPVILATRGVEVGGSQSKAKLGKKLEVLSEKQLKQKGLREWLKC
jgi:hypothetical protein